MVGLRLSFSRLISKRIGLALGEGRSAFACGSVHPGLTSWDIFSRPWRDSSFALTVTQDYVLGYSQPSLRDWFRVESLRCG